jgi:predicted unusual protein kinase regulating ubiquinone biosynthesis (AarF/ABC1/UbiB family)
MLSVPGFYQVQRPGIGDNIALDMFIVRKAAAWAEAHLDVSKATSLVAIVDEFASRLFAELDYVKVILLLFLLRKPKATI